MPAAKTTKRYRATRGVSVRKSADPKSPDYQEFVEFAAGDVLDAAPKHTDWAFLLETGAVEELGEALAEVSDGES